MHAAWSRYIEAADKWWECVGSPYADTYVDADDERLGTLLSSFEWFESWYADIKSIPTNSRITAKGKEKMFMAKKTFWAMQQTTFAFIGLVKHYVPKAPKGCGIRCWRCSQDPLEAYFVSVVML